MATLLVWSASRSVYSIIPTRSPLFAHDTYVRLLGSFRRSSNSSRTPPSAVSWALNHRLSSLNKPPNFKYDASPPDRVAVKALQSASCDPLHTWETSVQDGKATVATATLCMSAYLRSLEGMTQDEIKRKLEVEKPGKKLLLWLWSTENVDAEIYHQRIQDFLSSYAFHYELCYLLVEEKEEEYLWSWMATDAGDLDKSTVTQKAYLWRGFIARKLVEVKLHQAIASGTHSADAAIKTLWRVIKLKKAPVHEHSPPNDLLAHVSLQPAISILGSRLVTGDFQNTSVAQWNDFRNLVGKALLASGRYAERLDSVRLTCAGLDLMHPEHPDATLALEIIEGLTSKATEAYGWTKSRRARGFFARMLGTVIRVLQIQGETFKSAEVEHVRARLRKEWSDHFGYSPRKRNGATPTAVNNKFRKSNPATSKHS